MSETLPLQSEDPLPKNAYSHRYETHSSSGLGNIVSEDLKDPFTWLSTIHGAHPSESAKNIMWMLYRMTGHFPVKEDGPGKGRDETHMDDELKMITELDQRFINSYQKYLVKLDAEEASKRILAAAESRPAQTEPEHRTMPVLHEPHPELVALAMRMAAEAHDSEDVAA